jgi:hypothetical protein
MVTSTFKIRTAAPSKEYAEGLEKVFGKQDRYNVMSDEDRERLAVPAENPVVKELKGKNFGGYTSSLRGV